MRLARSNEPSTGPTFRLAAFSIDKDRNLTANWILGFYLLLIESSIWLSPVLIDTGPVLVSWSQRIFYFLLLLLLLYPLPMEDSIVSYMRHPLLLLFSLPSAAHNLASPYLLFWPDGFHG